MLTPRVVGAHVLAAVLLLGCAPASPDPTGPVLPSTSGAPLDVAPEAPPVGRLPTTVVPQRYALELELDPKRPTFRGSVTIDVQLKEPRRRIYLHGRDLRVSAARVFTSGGSGATAIPTTLEVKALADRSLLELTAPSGLAAGPARLVIEYEAPFSESLSGLYRVQSGGDWYVFSQMEPLDARRALPCFDEPSFKTPFDVTLVVSGADQAITNARMAEETPAEGGRRRVRYHETEKLPTYLLAFAVGPFDVVESEPVPKTPQRERPIPLRGVAPRGKGKHLGFALERHRVLVQELERYFLIAYPYDKLDVIAVPDASYGAMENAGAITYRDILLLVDPATATEAQRRDVVGVAAHELAHQWFGNLVTMQWWDDLWLNEAFATWMGQRMVETLHPQWHADLESIAWAQHAMDVDSLVSARAIRQKITTDDDVENAFDALTYSKGGGLISMYERYLGREAFQAGVKRYLDAHRFGNATADDFLAAVFRDKPELIESFRGFLDKPGVPALTVRCEGTSSVGLEVGVSRYLPLGSKGDPSSPFAVPLCARVPGASDTGRASAKAGSTADPQGSHCGLVGQGEKVVPKLGGSGTGCPAWFFPNTDGAAYARWLPSPAQAKATLESAMPHLSARERLSLADALRAGVFAGTLGLGDVLGALPKFAADPLREVAYAPLPLLQALRDDLVTPADQAKIDRAIVASYEPKLKALGWVERPGDVADVGLHRELAIEMLGGVGRHAPTRREALRRARLWLGLGGAPDPAALGADVRQIALVLAVKEGGAPVWDAVLARFKKDEDPLVRRHLLLALAAPTDDALAARARDLVLGDVLTKSERLSMLRRLADVPEQRRALWAWTKLNVLKLKEALAEGHVSYLPTLAEQLCDATFVPDVRATFEPHVKTMLGAPRALENAVERIATCSAVRDKVRAAR